MISSIDIKRYLFENFDNKEHCVLGVVGEKDVHVLVLFDKRDQNNFFKIFGGSLVSITKFERGQIVFEKCQIVQLRSDFCWNFLELLQIEGT